MTKYAIKITLAMLLGCNSMLAQKIESVFVTEDNAALRLTPSENGELITRAPRYTPFRIKEKLDGWYLVEEFYTNCRYYVSKSQVASLDVRGDSIQIPEGTYTKNLVEGVGRRRAKIEIAWTLKADSTANNANVVIVNYKKTTNGRLADQAVFRGKMLNSCVLLCEEKLTANGSAQKTHKLFWYVQGCLLYNGHSYTFKAVNP